MSAPAPELDRWARSRAGGELGRQRITRERLDGLAFAKRWREQARFARLTADQPTAAEARFPYPHRTCAEW